MPQILDELYHEFCERTEHQELKSSVEENRKLLSNNLYKEDRKCVLRIIDALEMVCNYTSKDSFLQSFKLGMELTTELQSTIPEVLRVKLKTSGIFYATG